MDTLLSIGLQDTVNHRHKEVIYNHETFLVYLQRYKLIRAVLATERLVFKLLSGTLRTFAGFGAKFLMAKFLMAKFLMAKVYCSCCCTHQYDANTNIAYHHFSEALAPLPPKIRAPRGASSWCCFIYY
jgi:hypothetical protein